MDNEQLHREILDRLGKLEGNVDVGIVKIDGINKRLDELNGRVAKNAQQISVHNEDIAKAMVVISQNSGQLKVVYDEVFLEKEQRAKDLLNSKNEEIKLLREKQKQMRKDTFDWVKWLVPMLLTFIIGVLAFLFGKLDAGTLLEFLRM